MEDLVKKEIEDFFKVYGKVNFYEGKVDGFDALGFGVVINGDKFEFSAHVSLWKHWQETTGLKQSLESLLGQFLFEQKINASMP